MLSSSRDQGIPAPLRVDKNGKLCNSQTPCCSGRQVEYVLEKFKEFPAEVGFAGRKRRLTSHVAPGRPPRSTAKTGSQTATSAVAPGVTGEGGGPPPIQHVRGNPGTSESHWHVEVLRHPHLRARVCKSTSETSYAVVGLFAASSGRACGHRLEKRVPVRLLKVRRWGTGVDLSPFALPSTERCGTRAPEARSYSHR